MNDLLTQLIECNQWRFVGRLAADPEIKYLQTGQTVCNARLLVNRPGQKRDDGQQPYRFKLTVWGDKAQAFADAARKGDLIETHGRVTQEHWTDQRTGEQRNGVVQTVDAYEVLLKAGQGQAPAPTTRARPATSAWAGAAPAAAPVPKAAPAWGGNAPDDSDIPF